MEKIWGLHLHPGLAREPARRATLLEVNIVLSLPTGDMKN